MDCRTETIKLIADLADVQTVDATSTLTQELGFDSLDRAELALQLEDKFFLHTNTGTIRDDEAQTWRTVQDVVNCVEENLRKNEGKKGAITQ